MPCSIEAHNGAAKSRESDCYCGTESRPFCSHRIPIRAEHVHCVFHSQPSKGFSTEGERMSRVVGNGVQVSLA
jgi:hypothetical protein